MIELSGKLKKQRKRREHKRSKNKTLIWRNRYIVPESEIIGNEGG